MKIDKQTFADIKRDMQIEYNSHKSELEELTDSDLHDRYDEMLDELYPDCKIAGYEYSTSHALKEVDPTAYRCGFNDWLNSEEDTSYREV